MSPSDADPNERPSPLARLGASRPLPDELEDRVIRSLRLAGAFDRPPSRSAWPPSRRAIMAAMLLAASLAFFVLGRRTADRPGVNAGAAAGTKWMLLLYEDESFQGPAPGREADYVEEYRAWATLIRGRGQLLDGAELTAGGGLLEPGGGVIRPGELVAPGAGRVTGYFVVTAPTLGKAGEIAATCPHIRHRGRIVIKPLGAG